MKILITGDYDPTYNRNDIIIRGLKSRDDVDLRERPYSNSRPDQEDLDWADLIFLPAFTHADVKPLRRTTKKPLVFDPLISKYLTKVYDYKQVHPWSPRALKNFHKDKRAMRNCDVLIADTQAHADYFYHTFGANQDRIHVVPVGVNTDDFPLVNHDESSGDFKVGFYGGFIPLQGTNVILEAAKILLDQADIKFELLGDGFEFEKMKRKAKELKLTNLQLLGWVKQEDLNSRLDEFDICLGIFGDSLKAELVIPNKIYHYASKGIPFISTETRGMKELFTSEENCLLIKNRPSDLTEAILKLKGDAELRRKLAQNSSDLIRNNYHTSAIAERFVQACKEALASQQ